MTRTVKKWSAKDASDCIITPSDQAAVRASGGAPINAEAIIAAIPETLVKLLKR